MPVAVEVVFEVAVVFDAAFDVNSAWGPDRREGSGFAVAFFLVTFSWRSKKK